MARTRIKSKKVKLCLDEAILDINRRYELNKAQFSLEVKEVMSNMGVDFIKAKEIVKKKRQNKLIIARMTKDINLLNQ